MLCVCVALPFCVLVIVMVSCVLMFGLYTMCLTGLLYVLVLGAVACAYILISVTSTPAGMRDRPSCAYSCNATASLSNTGINTSSEYQHNQDAPAGLDCVQLLAGESCPHCCSGWSVFMSTMAALPGMLFGSRASICKSMRRRYCLVLAVGKRNRAVATAEAGEGTYGISVACTSSTPSINPAAGIVLLPPGTGLPLDGTGIKSTEDGRAQE